MKSHFQLEEAEDIPEVDTIPPVKSKCFGDGFKVLVLGLIIFCISISIGLVVDIYYLRGEQTSLIAAAVTDAPECTKIANDLLLQNDNVVDAAVGGLLCLAVVRPQQCSLAGYVIFFNLSPIIILRRMSHNDIMYKQGKLFPSSQKEHK